MPVTLRAINPFSVVALCFLMAGGCNAYGFLNDEDSPSNDPAVLLDDARFALQDGDAAKAVKLLEKALVAAPDDAEIKITLSSALFQANDIDLLLLKDLADFITNAPGSQAGKTATAGNPVCSFADDAQATTALQFDDESAFVSLFERIDVLQRAVELIRSALRTEELEDMDDETVATARLVRAMATMAIAVIEIKTRVDAAEASIHWLSSGEIGYCAVDADALAALESFILCEQLPAIDLAIDDLVSRQQLFGASNSDLIDAIANARDEMAGTIATSCQGLVN